MEAVLLYCLLYSMFNKEPQAFKVLSSYVCVCMCTYMYMCTWVCTFVSGSWPYYSTTATTPAFIQNIYWLMTVSKIFIFLMYRICAVFVCYTISVSSISFFLVFFLSASVVVNYLCKKIEELIYGMMTYSRYTAPIKTWWNLSINFHSVPSQVTEGRPLMNKAYFLT